MIRLFPYIKKYSLPILFSIVLLFGQAQAELTLPDYLSDIVTYGIQQRGVDANLPEVLSADSYATLGLLMDEASASKMGSLYQRAEPGDSAYPALQDRFGGLDGQAVYQLAANATADAATQASLQKALAVLTFIRQAEADPQMATEMGAGLGLAQMPAGTSFAQLLAAMPAEQRAPLMAGISQRLDGLGGNVVGRMASSAVLSEYESLGADLAKLQMDYILRSGGMMVLITLLSAAATILVGLLSARVAAGVARDLREALFTRVSRFANAEMEKFSTASLITRATNDVTQLQTVTMMIIRMVFFAPIMGIGGMIRALDTAPSMGWIIALMVAALLAVIIGVFAVSMPRFKMIQTLTDNLNRVVRENLGGMMVVRAFNRQQFEETRFDKANQDLTGNMLFVSRVMVVMMPIMMLLMSGTSLLVVWVGAQAVAESQMQVGAMMAFMQYTMMIFFSFMFMSMMFIILPRAQVSANRIADVLETEPSIADPESATLPAEGFSGKVEFRDVSFHYPDAEEDVLHGISFVAQPGQTTAFIGTTGSGKSTIVSLMPRFYDVTGGQILLDGVDIRQMEQEELRKRIGYVPQRSNLFTGTIESNLRFGDEHASAEALALAMEIAQASEFVQANPEKEQAAISQGGTNVSGGQRQRLAIARALVKQAPIYIFDDSFSALDFKTDADLRAALKQHVAKSSVFIVSQRVATIKGADQIIVLDEGEIVGKGTHKELMISCDVYRDIATSQLSQEELA